MKNKNDQPAVELRRGAEAWLSDKQKGQRSEAGDQRATEDAARLVHELQVHQIELEMQNEELEQARATADALLARYSDLYDFAPTSYCTLDREGTIRQVNLTGALLLGVERSRLVNRRLGQFVAEGDRRAFSGFLEKVFASKAMESCEVTLPKEGSQPLVVTIKATRSADGQECRAVVLDITARNETEKTLRQNAVLAERGRLALLSTLEDQKRTHVALTSSLRDKDALVKEVLHRVKNNLQVVASLLRLESARHPNPETTSVLDDLGRRVHSMALLHEQLHRAASFAEVDLGAYVAQLSTYCFDALAPPTGAVRLQLQLTPVVVSMDQAVACGLLVNELISNAMKHGFPAGRAGEVRIELLPVAGGPQARLRLSDTGVGLPADFATRRGQSLGLQLATDLAKQMGGTLDIGPGPEAVFSVTFVGAPPRHASPAFRRRYTDFTAS